ncbi:MAG: GntR family transcriptional regulator [Actinobacteria bacterium]|jgi:GntR family transcriptional regulator|nr:GntR family transcriptional regulator [Actinomycetota bacterium]
MAEELREQAGSERRPRKAGASAPRAAMPAYARVAALIRQRIVDGIYEPGSKLPPERQFCVEFGVSAMTLRKALATLTHQGLVHAEKGRGTYIRSIALVDTVFRLGQLGTDWLNDSVEIRLLAASTAKAGPDVAQTLAVSPGDRVVYLKRLILKDEVPGMYHVEYLVSDVRQPIVESQLQLTSLQGVLDPARGRGFPYGRVKLRAACLDDEAARVLQAAPGSPALCLEHVFENNDRRPMSWGWFLMRGDLFQLTGRLGPD